MRPQLLLGLSATLATTIGIHACSTGTGADVVGANAGGTTSVGAGSSPGSGTGSSRNSSGGKSGSSRSGIDVSGTIEEDAACATDEKVAELTPVYMVFVYDSSGSMGDDPNNNAWQNKTSRWDPMREGMEYFFQNSGQVGVQASIVFFAAPGDQAATCHYDYSKPDVPMTSLQTPQALIDKLNEKVPNGGTPTLPAVMGGLKYAKKLVGNNPGSKAVVVLITDGEPYPASYKDENGEEVGCSPTSAPTLQNTIADISAVIEEAAKASPPIPTYVVGIGDANKSNMAQLAAAGNTDLIFIDTTQPPEKTTEALVQNLQAIRTKQIGCSMLVPTENFDPKFFNVKFKHSDGKVEDFGNSQNCTGPGWYFVPEDKPKQFTLCPIVCEKIQQDLNGTLQYVQGCPTHFI